MLFISKFSYRFCRALCKQEHKYIFFPDVKKAEGLALINETLTGFPQTYGAIDGCHIGIIGPQTALRDYINRIRFPFLFCKLWLIVNIGKL